MASHHKFLDKSAAPAWCGHAKYLRQSWRSGNTGPVCHIREAIEMVGKTQAVIGPSDTAQTGLNRRWPKDILYIT
jgi:hypothetical protein